MLYFTDGRENGESTVSTVKKQDIMCFASRSEAKQVLSRLSLNKIVLTVDSERTGTRFESHNGYDYICVSIPDTSSEDFKVSKVEIIFSAKRLLFFYDDEKNVAALINEIKQKEDLALSLEKVLYTFFARLLERDSPLLGQIEENISDLEDHLAVDDNASDDDIDYTTQVIHLRKKLLLLKRYYEGLFDLLEDLEENQNELLSPQQLRLFHIHTNRADRLYHSILNMRDYVTQVREAYQAQIDIQLNQTMKLFTVVTTIFLPLTLIAGWYGMNLMMPEFNWKYGYLGVIILSIAVVVGCVTYFKRHKWF